MGMLVGGGGFIGVGVVQVYLFDVRDSNMREGEAQSRNNASPYRKKMASASRGRIQQRPSFLEEYFKCE